VTEAQTPTRRVTLDDLAATRYDIAGFAELMGIRAHQGQIRIWREMTKRDETEFRPRWFTICISAGNRAGKTLMVAIAVLHHAIFKLGLRPPFKDDYRELEQFNRLPYDWYHFGIQQEIGELLFHAIVQLMEGTHDAQRGIGNPLVESFGPIAKYDVKERGEYRWIRIDKVLGGGEIHFRTTAERAVGSLGKDMNGISFDECGFENNLTFILGEVLHNRRLSTGGPIFLISTPSEGFVEFADEWQKGDPADPLKEPDRISFRMSTRENIGFGVDQKVFDRMLLGMPPHLIPQNIDGHFIQGRQAFFDARAVDAMFVTDRPEHEPCIPRHRYVQGVDPAAVYDSTWSIVLDCTTDGRADGVMATRKQGKQKVVDVAQMVVDTHVEYSQKSSQCETAVDVTGMGGKVFRQLLGDIHPFRGVEFGGTKKNKMRLLTDLKALIEQGRLRFPRTGVWLVLRRQLLAYALDDRRLEQDAVMALAVAVKQVMRQMGTGQTAAPFAFWAGYTEVPSERKGIPRTADGKFRASLLGLPLAGEDLTKVRLKYRIDRAVKRRLVL
jgi:hypothetical protein